MWQGIGVLIILVLLGYILLLKSQIHSIDQQLKKKLKESSRQPLHLQLLDTQLNQLVIELNRSFTNEEKMRDEVIDREREFKDMIANISHDLRTPLTSVKGYLQLIEKVIYARQGEDVLESYLSIVQNHTDELGDLIEHFYEYSYLCDVKQEPEVTRINLTNLVMDSVAAVLPQMEERGLSYELEETIYHVTGNAEMITRILQNLLRNCLSYAMSQINIYYTVENVTEDKNKVVLHVQNDLKETQEIDTEHLFERFYAGNPQKSTGLGLAIVRLLATQLGGETSAQLIEGKLDLSVSFPG